MLRIKKGEEEGRTEASSDIKIDGINLTHTGKFLTPDS